VDLTIVKLGELNELHIMTDGASQHPPGCPSG
jgi:hypothetical protein